MERDCRYTRMDAEGELLRPVGAVRAWDTRSGRGEGAGRPKELRWLAVAAVGVNGNWTYPHCLPIWK